MPKAPILFRETFFAHIRGSSNDYLGNMQFKQLEWNAVETELGTMVEPHQSIVASSVDRTIQIDLNDNSFNKFSRINEDAFQSQYGTWGQQLPMDYNA